MVKVFLSYARKDGNSAAAQLRAELERANFTVWRDIEDLQGGQEWKEQLRAALREIDALLVLLTPDAVESSYVTWEWENALTLQKRVIPLLISPCNIPPELGRLQYHDLSNAEIYAMSLMALVRDLNSVSESFDPQAKSNVVNDEARTIVQSDFYQPNWQISGDVIQAKRDVNINKRDTDQGSETLAKIFTNLMKQAETLPANDQEVIKPIINQAYIQAEKIQQGDESEETLGFLETRLRNLTVMAKDIGEVAIATLVSPSAGIALTIRKIAQKVKQEIES